MALNATHRRVDHFMSDAPKHLITLARKCTNRDVIIAVGGDGTLNEVVTGLAESTPRSEPIPPILHLALGSGNDFSATHDTPRSITETLAALTHPKILPIDLGVATINGDDSRTFFANSLGMGLEARAAQEAGAIRWLRGKPLYLAGLLCALKKHQQSHFSVNWRTPDSTNKQWDGDGMLVTIGNGPRSGGGLRLTPDAMANDGVLNIGVLGAVRRIAMLPLMAALLRGKHGDHPAVTLDECLEASIESSVGLPIHTDGEIVHHDATNVRVGVEKGRLRILVRDR